MRRAPQVLTRLGYTSTARLSAQLSYEVRRTAAGSFSVRECTGGQSVDRGALALRSRRWSSSEAVSNEPVEGKVAAVSSTVSSIGNNESQALSPESTASVPPPRRSNVTGEDAIPLHSSSASQGSSTGSSEKSEPWEIDARRRQNPLAPPAYDTPGLVGKARSRGDSSVDNNAYGRRWVAGRPLVVPRTTAEAIAMNREALRRQEASRSAGGEQSQGGQDGLGPSQEASSLGGAAHKMASDFGSRIETCRLHRQRSKIIKVWEEIEVAEKNGVRVKLSAGNYQNVMNALTSHRETQVVIKCGEVYDHMKANNVSLRPETYATYMKACSVASMGKRAVALMEDLDRTSDQTFRPTRLFMGDLLMATSKERLVEETKLFYGLMKAMNFSGNSRVLNAVLQLFLETDHMTDAIKVFEDMHKAGFKPKDAQSNKLVYHCVLKGNPGLVHEALDLIRESSSVIAKNTVQNVLYMAARKKDAELAKRMWVLAQGWDHQFSDTKSNKAIISPDHDFNFKPIKDGLEYNPGTETMDYNFTVSAFISSGKDQMAMATMVQACKEGRTLSRKTLDLVADKLAISNNRLDGAYYTLEGLHESGEPISTDAVNTIIAGSAIRFAVDRCFSTFDSLNRVFGVEPNVHSFNSMMRVLGGMRQQTEKEHAPLGAGMSVLDKMDRAGVKPDLETYEMFIDLICSSDIFDEDLIESVETRMAKDYNLEMQHQIMGKVACAFHDRGMYETAKKWAKKTPSREAYNGAEDRHLLDDAGRRGTGSASFAGHSRRRGGFAYKRDGSPEARAPPRREPRLQESREGKDGDEVESRAVEGDGDVHDGGQKDAEDLRDVK